MSHHLIGNYKGFASGGRRPKLKSSSLTAKSSNFTPQILLLSNLTVYRSNSNAHVNPWYKVMRMAVFGVSHPSRLAYRQLRRGSQSKYKPPLMQRSYSGSTPVSQTGSAGSIPVRCSNKNEIIPSQSNVYCVKSPPAFAVGCVQAYLSLQRSLAAKAGLQTAQHSGSQYPSVSLCYPGKSPFHFTIHTYNGFHCRFDFIFL